MANETELVISGLGVQPYSARGLTQTLEPIDASQYMRRTVNGSLKDLSSVQFRKLKSTITCTDFEAPALDGAHPGMLVTVDCTAELSYETASDADPVRQVVEGSSRTDGDFTFYRPRLSMRIVRYSQSDEEYGGAVSWQLELEEV